MVVLQRYSNILNADTLVSLSRHVPQKFKNNIRERYLVVLFLIAGFSKLIINLLRKYIICFFSACQKIMKQAGLDNNSSLR